MEQELQKALTLLSRYLRLQSSNTDIEMHKVLENLVQETRQKIAMLEKGQPVAAIASAVLGTSV